MNPYNTLEIDQNATPEQIKAAYRKLAAKHHPDRGGSTQKFQEIQAAYDTLTDPAKRAAWEASTAGGPGFPGGFPGGFSAGWGPNPFNDFVNQFFQQARQKIYTLTVFVTLEQILAGSVENVQLYAFGEQRIVQLQIPKNIEDGQQVAYNGIMPDGVLHVQFRIHQHPVFTRQGLNLQSTAKINMLKLIVGTKITVTDIHGKSVTLDVPPMTKPGTKLRLVGRGLDAGGDHYVLLEPELPSTISAATLEVLRQELGGG